MRTRWPGWPSGPAPDVPFKIPNHNDVPGGWLAVIRGYRDIAPAASGLFAG